MNEKSIALADYAFSHDVFLVSKSYVDITGDLIAGIVLSQIIYWFSPDKNGNSKIRVVKKDGSWLAKSREDWYKEIRISPKQYDRAIKILVEKGLIETSLHRFNGSPTIHIRPIWNNYNKAVNDWKQRKIEEINAENPINTPFLPFGENPIYPLGKMENDETVKTITENTTYIFSKNTNKENKEPISETEIGMTDDELSNIENNSGHWHWKTTKQYTDYIEKIMPKYIQEIAHEEYGKNSQVAYNILLEFAKMFFQRYRKFNGKFHPWYKKETLSKCFDIAISYFSNIYDHTNMEILTDYMSQFFEHDSMRNKPFAVFCTENMLEQLRKEIEEDWY